MLIDKPTNIYNINRNFVVLVVPDGNAAAITLCTVVDAANIPNVATMVKKIANEVLFLLLFFITVTLTLLITS